MSWLNELLAVVATGCDEAGLRQQIDSRAATFARRAVDDCVDLASDGETMHS